MKPAEQKQIKQAIIDQASELIEKHFGKVIAVKGDDNQINFGIAVQIEDDGAKHNVMVKLSFFEKHSFMLEREIDDPNQLLLPGTDGAGKKPTTLREKSKKT